MYITPDPETLWPRWSFEGDTPPSDRWMIFCFVVKTLVSSYSCPITPRGPKKRLTASVLHIPAAGMFSFLTLLFGDLVTSSCIISWWQTNRFWDARAHLMGGFEVPKKYRKFLCRSHRDDASHSAWTCWCMCALIVSEASFLENKLTLALK